MKRIREHANTAKPVQEHPDTSPGTYLSLALLAFALLGLELVLLLIEAYLPVDSASVEAAITHWILTSVIWAGGSVWLIVWAHRHSDFSLKAESSARLSVSRWSAIAVLIAVTWVGQWALRGGVLPPVAEHAALMERFGEAGLTAWIVQVMYYVAELSVMILVIGFGQRAGKQWLRGRWLPWGGVTLALTWGLVHFLTQDPATGAYGMVLSLVMGSVFVLTGRNFLLTYLVLLALFII